MSLANTNEIIKTYLDTCATLTALVTVPVGIQIYCPRLPENVDLSIAPAVSFFARGGTSTPYIPGIVNPSVQFDCWANSLITARQVYRALYDNLQGIENVIVGSLVIGTDGSDYRCILAHTATVADEPITGVNYATYWVHSGSGIGSAWVVGTSYALSYKILSAIEEVQGQDLIDMEIPNYFRVLTFFNIMIRASL